MVNSVSCPGASAPNPAGPVFPGLLSWYHSTIPLGLATFENGSSNVALYGVPLGGGVPSWFFGMYAGTLSRYAQMSLFWMGLAGSSLDVSGLLPLDAKKMRAPSQKTSGS